MTDERAGGGGGAAEAPGGGRELADSAQARLDAHDDSLASGAIARPVALDVVSNRAAAGLTDAVLRRLYLEEQLSMPEIASQFGVTRQYVYKLMRQSGIKARDLSRARTLALSKDRVMRRRRGPSGGEEKYSLQGGRVDEAFFSQPTNEMAWVLGLLFSDGCIHEKPPAVSLSQADPEILEKSLLLLRSNARIRFSEKRGSAGPLYHWRIGNRRVLRDLEGWGLTPRKSLSMTFPQLPTSLLSHFIRGLWDGDGTIFATTLAQRITYRAGYVSGSRDFLLSMTSHLESVGLPARTIYKDRRSNGHYFRYDGSAVARLAEYLYRDSSDAIRMHRKYELFRRAAQGGNAGSVAVADPSGS